MGKLIDLTGKKFGRLTVIERMNNGKHGHTRWMCYCECGNKTNVRGSHLTSGRIQSCGCLCREITVAHCTTHGMSKTRIYYIWCSIIDRCCNSNDGAYNNYGGRGISICNEWRHDFINFYNWSIANGYKESLTIDRIDVNSNYEPSNCRWTTYKEQNNNRRNNRIITVKNESHTLSEWGQITGINVETISSRIKRGWTIEKALTQPVRKLTRKTP